MASTICGSRDAATALFRESCDETTHFPKVPANSHELSEFGPVREVFVIGLRIVVAHRGQRTLKRVAARTFGSSSIFSMPYIIYGTKNWLAMSKSIAGVMIA